MTTRGISSIRRLTRVAKDPARFFRRQGQRRQRSLLRNVLPRGATRQFRQVNRLFGGGRGKSIRESDEPRIFEGLEEAPEGEEEAAAEPGTPRRGARPIYERRRELEKVIRAETESGYRLEFQSNTLAVIRPPSPFMRLLQMLLALLLLPLLLLKSLFGGGKSGGKAKMGKRLVIVDRRGRVQVRRI